MTYRRRVRLEVSLTLEDPHVPSLTSIYPTADWQERETWDFFGIIYDGHHGLTRIMMPDDWDGHPQRKDYPLGGVPVEYKGAEVPPPDQRRSYACTTIDDGFTGYAGVTETTEGRVYTVTGGDWDEVLGGRTDESPEERIVVNMGPQHPSTHGVLRLVLELEGETVTESRVVIGYLHTGIEKNTEFRSWVQGVTFVTRMDYLSPFFNETAYCLGVEKLLGVTDDIPQRATHIRVLLMELQRISSHLVWLATGGMEIGALSAMLYGFREREVDPRPLRDDHRPPDEPRVHPSRRGRPGPSHRRGREDPRVPRVHAEEAQGLRKPAHRPADLAEPAEGRRLPRCCRRASPSASPARCSARRACPGTSARPSPTAVTRPTTSTSPPRSMVTAGADTWSAWKRCASR